MGAILARSSHTVTILDTPTDPPGISINDISVTEGNTGTTPATFTLTLSGPAKPGTTVTYQTADGTGTAGVDYQAVGPVTVAIPAGARTNPTTRDNAATAACSQLSARFSASWSTTASTPANPTTATRPYTMPNTIEKIRAGRSPANAAAMAAIPEIR